MEMRARILAVAREVLQVAFGPWPMPSAVLLIASTMLFNYVVAGPYPGSGPVLAYQVALLPGSFLSAALFVMPVWISNYILRRAGRRVTRTWYLSTLVCAGIVMGVTRIPIIQTQGFDVPFTGQAILGFGTRSVVLALIVFAVAGVASSRIRRQARRAEQALAQVQESQVALVETEERVRADVSGFLHDRVQASLVALGLQLKYIARSADEGTSRQLMSLMEEVERIRTDDVRNAARKLSPDLESTTLVSALRAMASTYRPGMDVSITSTMSKESERFLTLDLSLALYRIAEQALLNSAVHARATHVAVTIEADEEAVSLTLVDNGSGLPLEPPPRGTGSLVMDTWAGLHSGGWSLQASDDGGAVLTARLPWPEQV